jgi:hypothetical protein
MLPDIFPLLLIASSWHYSKTRASPVGHDHFAESCDDDDGMIMIDSEAVSGAKISYKQVIGRNIKSRRSRLTGLRHIYVRRHQALKPSVATYNCQAQRLKATGESKRTTQAHSSGISVGFQLRCNKHPNLTTFLESRNDPKNSPLSLYLGGGPGTTSLGGATFENGPCFINPDSNSTTLNEWSWNNNVNMLYIDQPVQGEHIEGLQQH